MTILSIKNLWKKTQKKFELKDVSLTVNESEWLLITGTANDGKEVLQKVLLGFDVEWNGKIFFQRKEVQRGALISEKIIFIHSHFIQSERNGNIYGYLTFPLKLKGFEEVEIDEKVKNVTKNFFSEHQLTQAIETLTLSEKITIAFLRAILTEPDLIIIEEPFYQLSNSQRGILLTTIKKIAQGWKGCPVIIFSSYAYEWLDICDRIALFYNQTIIQQGTMEELLDDPKHVFVANFLMNESYSFLEGVINKQQFVCSGLFFPLFPLVNKVGFIEGQQIIIGIKATKIKIVEDKVLDLGEIAFSAPIHIIRHGSGYLKVYSNIGGQPFVAEMKNNVKIDEGKLAIFSFSLEDLLFFDGKTAKRLNKEVDIK